MISILGKEVNNFDYLFIENGKINFDQYFVNNILINTAH